MVAIAQTQMVRIASYLWEQTDGPTVKLSDIHTVKPTFITPYTASDKTLTFKLTVTDDDGAYTSSNVDVILKSINGSSANENLTSGENTDKLLLSNSTNPLSSGPTPTSVVGDQNGTSSLLSLSSPSNNTQSPIPSLHLQNRTSSFSSSSRALVDDARPPTVANLSNLPTSTADRGVSSNISGTTIQTNSDIPGIANSSSSNIVDSSDEGLTIASAANNIDPNLQALQQQQQLQQSQEVQPQSPITGSNSFC